MTIEQLEICNFRNYEIASFSFDKETNVLYGDNAQGKTNVLESIFLAGTTKSHRSSKDKDMIRMGQEEGHIRMFIEKKELLHKIDVHLKKHANKGIAVNGNGIKKSSELIGISNIIFFSPEDLSIIKNGPSERRRFINMELCQLDKYYLHYLTKYNKILQQRNNLLKQISFKRELKDTIEVWNLQLIENGKKIIKERTLFINELNEIICSIHNKLSGGKEEIEIVYEPNVSENLFDEKLFLSEEKDLLMKTTHVGPHRDDICFLINGQDVRKFGSQGQQRTAALSLKLAEIQIVRRNIKDDPILLLDDVLSELDRKRQNYLLESIKGIQTIITCTGLEEFIKSGININKTFEIENGSIKNS